MNDDLLRYAAGTMDEGEAERFEERLFADAPLAEQAARLVAVVDALRSASSEGPLVPVLTRSELDRLRAERRIAELRPTEGTIDAVIGSEEFVVAHIAADLSGARTIDVEFCSPDGAPYYRVHDAPFEPMGVVVACRSHVARAAGTLRVLVRDELRAVRAEVVLVNR